MLHHCGGCLRRCEWAVAHPVHLASAGMTWSNLGSRPYDHTVHYDDGTS